MKLKLSEDQGIHTLHTSGDLSEKDLKILHAGLIKLFKDGKNKVILQLSEIQTIPSEFPKNLSELNLIAEELSGQIVVVVADPKIRSQLENFSTPNRLRSFEQTSAAIQYFSKSEKSKEEIDSQPLASAKLPPEKYHPPEFTEAMEKKNEEIEKLRKLLEEKEKGELGAVKKENSQLKELVNNAESRLELLLKSRREAIDHAVYQKQIMVLQERIESLTQELQSKNGGSGETAQKGN